MDSFTQTDAPVGWSGRCLGAAMFKPGDHFIWKSCGEANVVISVEPYRARRGGFQFVGFHSVSNGRSSWLMTNFIRRCSRLEYSLLTKDV